MEMKLHSLALDGDKWSASCFGCFTYGEKSTSIYLTGGFNGPQRRCVYGGKEKNPQLC